MKRLHRRLSIGGVAAVLTLVAVVLWLGALARLRGVREIERPPRSLISMTMPEPDYSDTYRAPTPPNAFLNLDDVRAVAFERGVEIARSQWEVVYEGNAPGLTYHVSYFVEGGFPPTALRMTTSVAYRNWIGRVYFAVVGPFHRRGVPFMLGRMARRGPREPADP